MKRQSKDFFAKESREKALHCICLSGPGDGNGGGFIIHTPLIVLFESKAQQRLFFKAEGNMN